MADAELQDDGIDVSDGPEALSIGSESNDHMALATGGPPQATGKCSTCDSTMKWPKHLDSFRCQVCLMVNDLKPSSKPLGEAPVGEIPSSTASFNPGLPKKGERRCKF